jgi:ATP phosphoribosyltransferase regulatory subunit HisZ
LDIFLDEIGVKKTPELFDAVMKKNLSAIKDLSKENGEIISKIAASNDNLEKLSDEILTKIKSSKIAEELKKAQRICQFLSENFADVSVCFDLFGDHASSYHNEISFDVFCGNFSYPIARGGKYKIANQVGFGATIYMNRLRKI